MIDQGWEPVLSGEIYCSPRCGGRCKLADHNAAHDKADALLAIMGDGWEKRVWENLGWWWEVRKGDCRISPHAPAGREGDEPRLMLMWDLPAITSEGSRWASVPQIILHGSDPVALVGLAKQDARTFIARIEAALSEVW